MKKITIVAVVTATLFTPCGFSQNFIPARRIGMGATGSQGNLATELVEEQRPYRAIPVPLGLFQVFSNLRVFDPDDDEFDPVRAVETLSSPMHFTFNRDTSGPGNNF